MKKSILTVCAFALVPMLASAELYNIQLNGLASAYTGSGATGLAGDVWNNPTLTNMDNDNVNHAGGPHTLASGVSLVDSSGAGSSVTFSMTATEYKSAHAAIGNGSPIAGLTSRALKFDWTGTPEPAHLTTLSGLPANTAVDVYVLGGAGDGGGTHWTVNGVEKYVVADSSATANDVTLGSSQGLSWELFSTTTDGSGDLVIQGDAPGSGNAGVWWQSYVSGMQIEVIPEPATISLIAILGGGMLFIRRRFMI